jgi:hypothetical protein
LLAQAVLGGVSSPLAMQALPEILLLRIVLVISLIISLNITLVPLWTFANFATLAALATFL